MLEILQPAIFFLLGLVCVTGLWALSAPQSFLRLNRLCSTWVETRGLEHKLSESKISFDRLIYRHHVLSGLLLVAASLGLLYLVLFHLAAKGADAGLRIFAGEWSPVLYEFMLSFACLAGVVGIIIGMIVFIRPSSLKLAEAWGNNTVSPLEPLLERLDRRFGMVDVWVERHTRLFGGMVLLFAFLTGFMVWEVTG